MLGGYVWKAIMSDGSIVDQIDSHGIEYSVDCLKDKEVAGFILTPLHESFAPISIDLRGCDAWIKKWTRDQTMVGGLPDGEPITIDVFGITKNGITVYLYVYPDSSIRMSLHSEP